MRRITTITLGLVVAGFWSCVELQSQTRRGDLGRQKDDIVKEFTIRMHKLAQQYERAGDHDRAQGTLDLVLKVAPGFEPARQLRNKINESQLTENKKTLKILANKSWQNTGITVFQGKPVVIEARGTWVFRMNRTVDARGLEMPQDMKQFPLGSLIGIVQPAQTSTKSKKQKKDDRPRPFRIPDDSVLQPRETGTLYLKMHDSQEADNAGELTVTISGQIRS